MRQYPNLKDVDYRPTPKGDRRLIRRLLAHKQFRYAAEISVEQPAALPKPLGIEKQSASKSIHRRSPLIASYFPSSQEKLFSYSRQRRERASLVQSNAGRRSFSFSSS